MKLFQKVYFGIFLLGFLALAPSQALAQKNASGKVDLDPESERKSFQVAEGFEVNLFAADPQLAKPIQICFDTDGRLWAACSSTYPQVLPGQPKEDKILVMEDTDGDGKADKTTVFADGLLIPTGLAPGDGGVYVVDSTDLVHFSDTDGDGKADRKRIILSGFGTEDTHHMVHSLRWGMDGLLYFNQAIYIHSHLETPYGPKRLGGGGVWQFRPQSLELDIVMRGLVNSWGHHFDAWGQSFTTDGAGGEGINYVIPRGYYATAVGAKRIVQGLNPGSPKHCGLEILSGRHLPDSWQQSMITNDFRGHRVCRFTLEPDGAGYVSRQQTELIKTNHPAFRPIDVRQGPDGAIYLADWFNPIIQHGEVDFRDPRRDKTHGRIWRVTAKGRPLVPRPALKKDTPIELLNHLKDPEMWTRHMARREFVERGPSAIPALNPWAQALDSSNEPLLLEALWTFQAVDQINEKLLQSLLRARDPRIRAAAVRVTAMWRKKIPAAKEAIEPLVTDPNPQVRLEAVRALGLFPSPNSAQAALKVLDLPMDRFLDYSLWQTLQELEAVWLPAFSRGELSFGRTERLIYALRSSGGGEVAKRLGELVREEKIPDETLDGAMAHLAEVGGPGELALLLSKAVANPDLRRAAIWLDRLVYSMQQRGVKPAVNPQIVLGILSKENSPLTPAGAKLAGLLKLEAARGILEKLTQTSISLETRLGALQGLEGLGGKPSVDFLARMAVEKSQPVEFRKGALKHLAGVDLNLAANLTKSAFLNQPQNSADTEEIFGYFLGRKDGINPLVASLSQGKITADAAKIGIRQAKVSGRETPTLIQALEKAGGLGKAPAPLTQPEYEALVKEVTLRGDPARGQAVFRRKDLNCLKCHALSGAGGLVGPDLTSLGASAQVDYLVDSLINPNKAIKENYHSLVVTTVDGKIFTGVKVRQNDKELVLRDAEDREVAIPAKKIEEQKNGKSLMPEGLIDSLTRGELLDLARFLSELGKPGPYGPGKASIVRRFEALEPTPQAYTVLSRMGNDAIANPAEPLLWSAVYATAQGDLLPQELPQFTQNRALEGNRLFISFVRFAFETGAKGKAGLKIHSPQGVTFWVDGKPSPMDKEGFAVLELEPGKHLVVLRIDRGGASKELRLELDDIASLPAKTRITQGK